MIKTKELSQSLINDSRSIIETTLRNAYTAINVAMVQRNWMLGKRIAEYGKGFDYSSLYKYVRFYKEFPYILDSPSPKSQNLLSWTHYRTLLQVDDTKAREWYASEAFNQTWSIRTLQRNISSQYYYRMLQSHDNAAVESEMKAVTAPLQNDQKEIFYLQQNTPTNQYEGI